MYHRRRVLVGKCVIRCNLPESVFPPSCHSAVPEAECSNSLYSAFYPITFGRKSERPGVRPGLSSVVSGGGCERGSAPAGHSPLSPLSQMREAQESWSIWRDVESSLCASGPMPLEQRHPSGSQRMTSMEGATYCCFPFMAVIL